MINSIRSTAFCAVLSAVITLPLPGGASGQSNSGAKSRVIVGATVIDGSGRKAFVANVRIVGDRIANVGKFVTRADEEIIQARGLFVAPGFIDIHNHSEGALISDPAVISQVSQGITTLVAARGARGRQPGR